MDSLELTFSARGLAGLVGQADSLPGPALRGVNRAKMRGSKSITPFSSTNPTRKTTQLCAVSARMRNEPKLLVISGSCVINTRLNYKNDAVQERFGSVSQKYRNDPLARKKAYHLASRYSGKAGHWDLPCWRFPSWPRRQDVFLP